MTILIFLTSQSFSSLVFTYRTNLKLLIERWKLAVKVRNVSPVVNLVVRPLHLFHVRIYDKLEFELFHPRIALFNI